MPVRMTWPSFQDRWPALWTSHVLPVSIGVFTLAEAGLVTVAALIPWRRSEGGDCSPSWLPEESARRAEPCAWVRESEPVATVVMIATGLLVATAVLMQLRAWRSSRSPCGIRASVLQALGALLCLAAAAGVLAFGYGPYPA